MKIPENTRLAAALVLARVQPPGYSDVLGPFDDVVKDNWYGPTIGWGFPITGFMGETRFEELREYGEPHCLGWKPTEEHGTWVLVTHWLTADEATELYGPAGEVKRGPRGGFKGIVYGTTLFIHPKMRPDR